MKFIKTELNKIEISHDKNADFELSIDGFLMHKSDVDELYELLKEVKENELLHSVRLSCFREVWQKWCEAKSTHEFDGWLHAKMNDCQR